MSELVHPSTSISHSGRARATEAQLRSLVEEELGRRVAGADAFTAYDITRSLRAANPLLDIPHYHGVREIVHDLMGTALQLGLHTAETVFFRTGPALRYVAVIPVSRPSSTGTASAAQLPGRAITPLLPGPGA